MLPITHTCSNARTHAGISSRLFTHSYLGLGMDTALQQAADYVIAAHRQAREREEEEEEDAGGDAGGSARAQEQPILDPCLPKG